MCENNDPSTSQPDVLAQCDTLSTNTLALHGKITELRTEISDVQFKMSDVRSEMAEIHTRVDELTAVIGSARDIDLTPVYSAFRPHTDKWFRDDGTLRTHKFSRRSIPIRAYRARIPLSWVNTPTREVHIKFLDPEFHKLNLPVEDLINEVVGPDSAEVEYLNDYTDLVYWYFRAPDSECDRLAKEIVRRILDMVFNPVVNATYNQ